MFIVIQYHFILVLWGKMTFWNDLFLLHPLEIKDLHTVGSRILSLWNAVKRSLPSKRSKGFFYRTTIWMLTLMYSLNDKICFSFFVVKHSYTPDSKTEASPVTGESMLWLQMMTYCIINAVSKPPQLIQIFHCRYQRAFISNIIIGHLSFIVIFHLLHLHCDCSYNNN